MSEEHYEGTGCQCAASSESDCGCSDADWTPREVYQLRREVEDWKMIAKAAQAERDLMAERLDLMDDGVRAILNHAQKTLDRNKNVMV